MKENNTFILHCIYDLQGNIFTYNEYKMNQLTLYMK